MLQIFFIYLQCNLNNNMKKIKHKYIRLTEERLNNIVKECVQRELSLITEYAIKRKEFKFHFYSLLPQIIQNWFLIHYCTVTNTEMNDFISNMKNIADIIASKNIEEYIENI